MVNKTHFQNSKIPKNLFRFIYQQENTAEVTKTK